MLAEAIAWNSMKSSVALDFRTPGHGGNAQNPSRGCSGVNTKQSPHIRRNQQERRAVLERSVRFFGRLTNRAVQNCYHLGELMRCDGEGRDECHDVAEWPQ